MTTITPHQDAILKVMKTWRERAALSNKPSELNQIRYKNCERLLEAILQSMGEGFDQDLDAQEIVESVCEGIGHGLSAIIKSLLPDPSIHGLFLMTLMESIAGHTVKLLNPETSGYKIHVDQPESGRA